MVLDGEKFSPITSETVWEHPLPCHAPKRVLLQFKIGLGLLRMQLTICKIQGTFALLGMVGTARRGSALESHLGLCAGLVWAQRQLQRVGFSILSEIGINTSWFLTSMVQSFILLYLSSTLKIQIPSITICFNMHVLLVKYHVKAQLSSQPQWY